MTEETITIDDLHEVPCPHCGYKTEMWENSTLTTYWAEEGEQEKTCNNCNKTFFILERISRDWEIAKKVTDY